MKKKTKKTKPIPRRSFEVYFQEKLIIIKREIAKFMDEVNRMRQVLVDYDTSRTRIVNELHKADQSMIRTTNELHHYREAMMRELGRIFMKDADK